MSTVKKEQDALLEEICEKIRKLRRIEMGNEYNAYHKYNRAPSQEMAREEMSRRRNEDRTYRGLRSERSRVLAEVLAECKYDIPPKVPTRKTLHGLKEEHQNFNARKRSRLGP